MAPTTLKTWRIAITEVRTAQYQVTMTSPNGDEYTIPRVLGAINVLARVTDFITRLVFMTEA